MIEKRERLEERENLQKGFSLLESLISLSLFLFLIVSSLQFFGFARHSFFKLKKAEETREAVLSTLEKIKIDVLHAGFGLVQPIRLGVLDGIEENNKNLIILSRDKEFYPLEDLVPGQLKIPLESIKGLKKKREICIFDSNKGEVKQISSLNGESIVLSSPLNFGFLKKESQLLLLKKTSFYFDEKKQIIRRKVNNSPSQPLLEEASSFDFRYEEAAKLIHVSLTLKSVKEKKYETSVFLKNIALAFIQ